MKLFDAKMPSSKQLVRHCLYFDGGHGVPKSIMSDIGFHAEYDAWLNNALSLSLAVEDGPKKLGNTAVANVLRWVTFLHRTLSRKVTHRSNEMFLRGDSTHGSSDKERLDRQRGNLSKDDAMERGEGETENSNTTFSTDKRLNAVPRDENVETRTTPSCLLYTSPSPRDQRGSRMPSSA